VSTLAPERPPARRPPARPAPVPPSRPAAPPEYVSSPLAARLAAFLALALFAGAHWTAFLVAPTGRLVGLAVLCSGLVAAALALTGTPRARAALLTLPARVRGPAAGLARAAIVALGLTLGAAAVGLPGAYLRPGRWDELWVRIDRALPAIYRAQWPYDGSEGWVALTMLLAVPAVCTAAAALAFWPGRIDGPRRVAALALLLVLYGVAITERPLPGDLVRGAALLALVGAWLWLPRLPRRDLAGASAALLAAAVAAMALGGALRERPAWVDYESWSVWDRGGSTYFNWTHSYGAIEWPRDGTTLLYVRARRGHYWKVQTLDAFDGLRWYHTGVRDRSSPGLDIPSDPFSPRRRRRWVRRLVFTVAALRSEWVTTAGIPEFVNPAERYIDTYITPSGVRTVGRRMRKGDSYEVRAYVPEPGAGEMRTAPPPAANWLSVYTRFVLPGARGAMPNDPVPPVNDELYQNELLVQFPLPGEPTYGRTEQSTELDRRSAARRVLDSPYAEVYRLSQRLARGTSSQYALVRRIENHLRESGGFSYSEDPPQSEYPLRDFLLRDKAGYCQHFSGAMALMLRMNGIPARVAAGFSPGSFNRDTSEYRVRDLDAHSWVEVWFEGLGWVAFDPTPPLAPARSQTTDFRGADVPRGGALTGPGGESNDPVPDLPGEEGFAPEDEGGATRWIVAGAAFFGALLLALGARALWGGMSRRAGVGDELEVAELEAALRRLGYSVPPGTTLLALERRVARMAGPEAARYVRRLRERRFAPGRGRAPSAQERRALRRGLARGAGRLGRLRALRALPPVALRSAPRRSEGAGGHALPR
jgi:transglutaminase-like putative cysteine protease